MIISHKHKFIFLHLQKCAGSSITLALAPYLGRDDIILGCTKEGERLSRLGYANGGLAKHSSAQKVRDELGEQCWQEYYKFSFVRNPWELVASKYHWWQITPGDWSAEAAQTKKRIMGMTFQEYVSQFGKPETYLSELLSSCSAQDLNSQATLDIDFVGRFEAIQQDFNHITKTLALPDIQLIYSNRSGSNKGNKNVDYRQLYDAKSKAAVAALFAAEIKQFAYEFAV